MFFGTVVLMSCQIEGLLDGSSGSDLPYRFRGTAPRACGRDRPLTLSASDPDHPFEGGLRPGVAGHRANRSSASTRPTTLRRALERASGPTSAAQPASRCSHAPLPDPPGSGTGAPTSSLQAMRARSPTADLRLQPIQVRSGTMPATRCHRRRPAPQPHRTPNHQRHQSRLEPAHRQKPPPTETPRRQQLPRSTGRPRLPGRPRRASRPAHRWPRREPTRPRPHSMSAYAASSATWVSLLMSTRQPVIRAERRAF